MGTNIMSERAKLVLVFGVPMSTLGVSPAEHQMSRSNFTDEDGETLAAAYVEGIKPGLMRLGDMNSESVVFGIPVKIMDLHVNSHHLPYPELPPKARIKLREEYDALWKAASFELRSALTKLNHAEPAPFLVLDIK